MSEKIIRLIDRTRTVQDWKCARSRWWGYEYLDKGIVKSGTSLELFIGIVTHDALAAIATFTKDGQPVPIDEIASAANLEVFNNIMSAPIVEPDTQEFAKEQGTLIEGMIRGFYKHVWPKLMAQFPKIVAVEAEMEYDLATVKCQECHGTGVQPSSPIDADICRPECSSCGGSGTSSSFIFMTKPDLIVEDQNGELVYLEYKTTKSKKDTWVKSWDTAVQLHSSIMAVEQTMGQRPSYVQIVGLYKGYESYGKQSSPFCYAYMKKGNPPFTEDQVQYDYKAGFKRYATWELPGGVKAWVEGMPDLVLADQFPMTAPIMVDEDLIKSFFDQRLIREKEIADFISSAFDNEEAFKAGLDKVFPQKFDQCVPNFGWACPYKKLCFGRPLDPLTEGYEFRTPHHEKEMDRFSSETQ